MASASNTAMEALAADLIEDKIISDYNSSHGDREKAQEEQPAAKGQVDAGRSERLTALLQVVGAFFLMFHSCYAHFTVKGLSAVSCRYIGDLQTLLVLIKIFMRRKY